MNFDRVIVFSIISDVHVLTISVTHVRKTCKTHNFESVHVVIMKTHVEYYFNACNTHVMSMWTTQNNKSLYILITEIHVTQEHVCL